MGELEMSAECELVHVCVQLRSEEDTETPYGHHDRHQTARGILCDERTSQRGEEHLAQCEEHQEDDQQQAARLAASSGDVDDRIEDLAAAQEAQSDSQFLEEADVSLRTAFQLVPKHSGERSGNDAEQCVAGIEPVGRDREASDLPAHVRSPVIVSREVCQVPEQPEDDLECGNQDDAKMKFGI